MTSKISRRTFLKHTSLAAAGTLLAPAVRLCSARAEDQDGLELPAPARLAIIIDDLGYNFKYAAPFLTLGLPLTFSILPRLTYSRRLAEKIKNDGHEIMLHQPMEPHSYLIDPGPGALYIAHTHREMQQIIRKNLESFPFPDGVNNHMGSLFTESKTKVQQMLEIFQEQEFFFVDSFTSSHSIAFDTARELHMVSAFRNVFIDNVFDADYIYHQLRKVKRHALKYGYAIGIGHPRPETVRALELFMPELDNSGIELVYASCIVREKSAVAACRASI